MNSFCCGLVSASLKIDLRMTGFKFLPIELPTIKSFDVEACSSVWMNSAGLTHLKTKRLLFKLESNRFKNGGADGTRTRDLRRDRPAF